MNTHANPCTETRTHLGLRQQCSLGKEHTRPHTWPAIGEAEYAALYRDLSAMEQRAVAAEARAEACQIAAAHRGERLVAWESRALAAEARAERAEDERDVAQAASTHLLAESFTHSAERIALRQRALAAEAEAKRLREALAMLYQVWPEDEDAVITRAERAALDAARAALEETR